MNHHHHKATITSLNVLYAARNSLMVLKRKVVYVKATVHSCSVNSGGLATRAILAKARKAALKFETRAGIRCTLFYFPAFFSNAGRHLKISQPYLYKDVPLRTARYTNYSYSYVLTGNRCHCIQFVANVSFMR